MYLTDTPATHVTLPVPAPLPMPNSRRPTQPRARQQQEYLRSAQCGSDPEAFKGTSDRGLMLHVVQKYRAACVLCDWRCHRCSHCKRDTPTRDITVGDILQDRRQPGHQDAAPVGSPNAHHPPHRSQPVPPGDPFDDSPPPNCSIRDIIITERDKQLLADLRRASAMAIPRCIVSRCATAWADRLMRSHQWPPVLAILCPYRCRPLLLAEVPEGSDRVVETSTSALGSGRDK